MGHRGAAAASATSEPAARCADTRVARGHGVYRPRRPRASPLYRLIERHFSELSAVYDDRFAHRYGEWRPVICPSCHAKRLPLGSLEREGRARIRAGDGLGQPASPGSLARGTRERTVARACQYVRIDSAATWSEIAPMAAKSQQLQVRVAPHQKATLKRLASAAGLDVSAYVLARVLPPDQARFAGILHQLHHDADRRFALAELNDLLARCAPAQFADAVGRADLGAFAPLVQNYVAAMVEQAAAQKGVQPPAWVHDVAPLEEPHFGAPLQSLRLHLLRAAPVAFKRRNIFVDASVGDRV